MPAETAEARLMDLILGGLAAQVPRALVDLGVADAMGEGIRAPAALATELGLHAPSLDRLLQAAITLGLAETADGGMRLTAMGGLLRAGAPGGLGPVASMYAGEHFWATEGALPATIRDGRPATDALWGTSSFQAYSHDPVLAAGFDAAMTALSDLIGPAVARALPFEGLIVDVGGGQGRLMGHILAAHPAARGLLFDLPHVAVRARAYLQGLGLAGRCQVMDGDLLEAVPAGGDVYVLSAVIHDWDDERAVRALANCRRAMGPTARLLLVERVLSDAPGPNVTDRTDALVDLLMMVRNGGRERTRSAYRDLLHRAGYDLVQVIPTGSLRSVIEARPLP